MFDSYSVFIILYRIAEWKKERKSFFDYCFFCYKIDVLGKFLKLFNCFTLECCCSTGFIEFIAIEQIRRHSHTSIEYFQKSTEVFVFNLSISRPIIRCSSAKNPYEICILQSLEKHCWVERLQLRVSSHCPYISSALMFHFLFIYLFFFKFSFHSFKLNDKIMNYSFIICSTTSDNSKWIP